MRKVKRKYTRKTAPDALEVKSSGIEKESNTIPQVVKDKSFSFKDLPLSIRLQVEGVLNYRKLKGLKDDSVERKERAIRNFRGDRDR